ncbi:ABC transporter ATP-binding protein [Methanosarcina sp. Mfa9]|uniref:ABC transporter ATP-binding protein n=1 Tax=Methanosarcina sp. Mfa9 TaxID=3439063 RepID=UPI003F86C05A
MNTKSPVPSVPVPSASAFLPGDPSISKEGIPLLDIKDLKVSFPDENGTVKPIYRVDLTVKANETLGLIGESGSGKSILGLSILRLLPGDAEVGGKILFKGQDLLSMPSTELRKIRGREIGMVFQNPAASLDPIFTVGGQLSEATRVHFAFDKNAVKARVLGLLDRVSIKDPALRFGQYPHELSGGMKQRVMIATGIASEPSLIIADEPTRGLDVTVKRRIISLMQKISRDTAMLLVTHDLEVAEQLCDRVAVMYAGEIVEIAGCEEFFKAPLHPFSEGLLNSLPSRGMHAIPGTSPSLIDLPSGCRFYPRCRYSMDICRTRHPELVPVDNAVDGAVNGDMNAFFDAGRLVRCFLYA